MSHDLEPARAPGKPVRLLFLSNGHGEDSIAGTIIDRLRASSEPASEINGWPMVGAGAAYRRRDIPIVGAPNELPSCGFATLSARWLWRDVRSGWIATHWRQAAAARGLRGRYALAVAVGDLIPAAGAVLARLPLVFVGCAKSSYYRRPYRYRAIETHLLRRYALLAFARDEQTAADLARAGIRARYAGNPLMDDLEGSMAPLGIPEQAQVVGLLPGSREDACENLMDLLEVAAAIGRHVLGDAWHFACAAAQTIDEFSVRERLPADSRGAGWNVVESSAVGAPGLILRLRHTAGSSCWIFHDRFADVVRRATLVIGLAGTANEQAVGMGKPLITFPTRGVMGPSYVRMKMQLFGEAAWLLPREPSAVARATIDLMNDTERQTRMAAAGRARMGRPGACDAIAAEIRARLLQEACR